MTYFATNLTLLRKHRKLSQQHMADLYGFTRSRWAGWERGEGTPNYSVLVLLAGFFHVRVDRLLCQDLRCLSQFHLGQLLRGHDLLTYIDGKLDPVK